MATKDRTIMATMQISKHQAKKDMLNRYVTGYKLSNGSNVEHNSTHSEPFLYLDGGDPKLFYPYWKMLDDECSVTIKASDLISYFVNPKEGEFPFQLPGFADAVRRVHGVVGNAVTDGRYIIGGTGSSQLFIYTLRALASIVYDGDNNKPVPVVCPEPYYSNYGEAIEAEKSKMYEWRGDANSFKDEEGPYIEIVTSPNNPDGGCREPVVKRQGGLLIHDLAYYWPQYTPITAPADYDIMLFTMSKATGHAGSRVGWVIAKDKEIASKIMKQVYLMSLGSCQEGQLRAMKILQFTADSYEQHVNCDLKTQNQLVATSERLFEFGHRVMAERWKRLRAVVNRTGVFTLPDFPPAYCTYFGKLSHATPGFAWMKCDRGDAAQIMKQLKVQVRAGSRFGSSVSGKYVRVSLMGTDDSFNLFLERLARLS